MSRDAAHVAVLGGGVAGLAAATTLAAEGLKVIVFDENSSAGGQYLRSNRASATGRDMQRLLDLKPPGIEMKLRCRVLGIEPDRTILAETETQRLLKIQPDFILLATGAREKFWPFPGWTLPGILATGAAQMLIKSHGVLPGERTVIAGRGFFPWTVAREVFQAGGCVPLVADESSLGCNIRLPFRAWRHWPKLVRTAGGLLQLAAAGSRLRWRTRIVEARGAHHIQEVVVARVNGKDSALSDRRQLYPADALAVGYGFQANCELAQLCGCELVWEPSLGGWVVGVSGNLQTSRESIFAAGEITGIGGAVKSAIEGRLAALSLVKAAGIHDNRTRLRQINELRRFRSHELVFARWLNSLTGCSERQMRSRLAAIPDSTVVCRCEDIRMGDVRQAMERGYRSAAAIKRATRIGMGCCQGSVCQTFLQDLLMVDPGASMDRPRPPSVRIPVRPVSLGVLARGLEEPLPEAPRDRTI